MELKAYTIYEGDVGNYTEHVVYSKSEADKVIADLEKKLDLYKRGFKEDDKINAYLYAELRHQKYKRCLYKAKWCHNQREIYERDSYNWELEKDAVDSLRNKTNIMRKWHKRWLELAEKFKEAKK